MSADSSSSIITHKRRPLLCDLSRGLEREKDSLTNQHRSTATFSPVAVLSNYRPCRISETKTKDEHPDLQSRRQHSAARNKEARFGKTNAGYIYIAQNKAKKQAQIVHRKHVRNRSIVLEVGGNGIRTRDHDDRPTLPGRRLLNLFRSA